VQGKGVVRIDPQPPPEPGRRWPAAAAAVAVVVVGALAGLGALSGSGGNVSEETVPEVGPGPVESAMLVVEEFAAAWNQGDAAVADGLVADDWDLMLLPGFLDPRFSMNDGRPALSEGIAFLAAVTRLSLGPCRAEVSPPDEETTAVVRCDEAEFRGDYLEALEVGARVRRDRPEGRGISFGIAEGEIISIDATAGLFSPQAYCIWAGQTHPELADTLFDLYCYPEATAASGTAHAELAAEFVVSGRPHPSPEMTEARLAAAFVARSVENLNEGNPLTPLRWMSGDVSAEDLPGYAGAAEVPGIADFLLWTGRLLDIEPGTCSVRFEGEHTVVTCPEMSVEGPIVGEPQPQPTRFTLLSSLTRVSFTQSFHRIVGVEPLDDTDLRLEETCRRLRNTHPSTASQAFGGNCTPIYSRDAAEALAAALEEA
jgi:hypothetical protein